MKSPALFRYPMSARLSAKQLAVAFGEQRIGERSDGEYQCVICVRAGRLCDTSSE
jgi:hypothetical protein